MTATFGRSEPKRTRPPLANFIKGAWSACEGGGYAGTLVTGRAGARKSN